MTRLDEISLNRSPATIKAKIIPRITTPLAYDCRLRSLTALTAFLPYQRGMPSIWISRHAWRRLIVCSPSSALGASIDRTAIPGRRCTNGVPKPTADWDPAHKKTLRTTQPKAKGRALFTPSDRSLSRVHESRGDQQRSRAHEPEPEQNGRV